MEPNLFGRKLGIGVRVASRVVKGHMEAHAKESAQETRDQQAAAAQAVAPETTTRVEAASRQAAQAVRQNTDAAARTVRRQAPVVAAKARGVREGARRFGKAMWGPFAHVSSVLWSEVTGAFFGLFAFYFAMGIVRLRTQYKAGPGHEQFVLNVVLTLVFGYFAASSFYIAHRKKNKRR